jgi:hypothetical protein
MNHTLMTSLLAASIAEFSTIFFIKKINLMSKKIFLFTLMLTISFSFSTQAQLYGYIPSGQSPAVIESLYKTKGFTEVILPLQRSETVENTYVLVLGQQDETNIYFRFALNKKAFGFVYHSKPYESWDDLYTEFILKYNELSKKYGEPKNKDFIINLNGLTLESPHEDLWDYLVNDKLDLMVTWNVKIQNEPIEITLMINKKAKISIIYKNTRLENLYFKTMSNF